MKKNQFQPKAVIYDMDGVLIDSEPHWKIAEINAFRKVGIELTNADCEKTVGMRIDEVVQFWHNQFPWKNTTIQEVADDIMNNLVELIQEKGRPLEGVKESLDYFKSKGVKIGLATSSYQRILECVLKKLEIKSFFEVVRSAQVEEYGKPHPAVYINTAKEMNVTPEDCLVIEDSFTGMISGLAAKMKVLVIPEKSHAPNEKLKLAHYHADSLKEVKQLFK